MYKPTAGSTAATAHRLFERLPWCRRLLQYSFVFFLVKGLVWTALLALPLVSALL